MGTKKDRENSKSKSERFELNSYPTNKTVWIELNVVEDRLIERSEKQKLEKRRGKTVVETE